MPQLAADHEACRLAAERWCEIVRQMLKPWADHEARRLAAVRRYEILDTPPDAPLDRIAAMAAKLCGAPISMISLVDHDRIAIDDMPCSTTT